MFTIRKMHREDIPDVAELERKIFSDAWSERAILETLSCGQAMILTAYEKQKLIGYLILYGLLEDGEIARIAVAEGSRRQGVASRMLREAEILCADDGMKKLLLDVREGNQGAIAFYEKHGFVRDGLRRNYYSDPVEDAILMSLTIRV